MNVKWPGDICGCNDYRIGQFACASCWKKISARVGQAKRFREILEKVVSKCKECGGSGFTCPAGPHCACGMGMKCSGPDIQCPECASMRAALAMED